jgi:hypothetical protein
MAMGAASAQYTAVDRYDQKTSLFRGYQLSSRRPRNPGA